MGESSGPSMCWMITTVKDWALKWTSRLPAVRVVRSLNQIIEWRGAPQIIRVDNGPEYVSGLAEGMG